MFEQTRQHYLKQMGVTLWYSRCELPGAAASPEFAFGANIDDGANSDPDPQIVNDKYSIGARDGGGDVIAVPKSAADILNVLSSTLATPSQQDAPLTLSAAKGTALNSGESRVPVVAQTETSDAVLPIIADKAPSFPSAPEIPASSIDRSLVQGEVSPLFSVESLDLMLWVGKKNWIISDNNSEYPDLLKRQLLLNIASALGEDTESADVVCFRWPFFGNKRLPGNDTESMLAMLLEWLGERVVSDHLNGFLMGEVVGRLLLKQAPADIVGNQIELNISDERGIKVIPTLSLNDLLREPLNKRVAWQHLRNACIK